MNKESDHAYKITQKTPAKASKRTISEIKASKRVVNMMTRG